MFPIFIFFLSIFSAHVIFASLNDVPEDVYVQVLDYVVGSKNDLATARKSVFSLLVKINKNISKKTAHVLNASKYGDYKFKERLEPVIYKDQWIESNLLQKNSTRKILIENENSRQADLQELYQIGCTSWNVYRWDLNDFNRFNLMIRRMNRLKILDISRLTNHQKEKPKKFSDSFKASCKRYISLYTIGFVQIFWTAWWSYCIHYVEPVELPLKIITASFLGIINNCMVHVGLIGFIFLKKVWKYPRYVRSERLYQWIKKQADDIEKYKKNNEMVLPKEYKIQQITDRFFGIGFFCALFRKKSLINNK